MQIYFMHVIQFLNDQRVDTVFHTFSRTTCFENVSLLFKTLQTTAINSSKLYTKLEIVEGVLKKFPSCGINKGRLLESKEIICSQVFTAFAQYSVQYSHYCLN